MCQAFEAESNFVMYLERTQGRCDVCKKLLCFHDWRCEAHPRHEEWKASGMYRPEQVIRRKT